MSDEEDQMSMLDQIGGGSRDDVYFDGQERPIKCGGCLREKRSPDLIDPEVKLWWNFHGYPRNASRHAKICGYCEFIWHKQFPEKKCEEYCVYCQTPDGGRERSHYEGELVAIRRRRGQRCRITPEEWKKIPLPTKVEKSEYAERFIQDADEIFYTPEQHLNTFGVRPEDAGYHCEWVDHRGKKRWGCWRDDGGPLKRVTRQGQKTTLTTEVDNNEEALSEDQLVKRFKAEAEQVSPPSALKAGGSSSSRAPGSPPSAAPLGGAPLAAAASSPPTVGPTHSRNTTRGASGRKTEITEVQRKNLIEECTSLATRWEQLKDETSLNAWDTECTKTLKNVQKRQAQLLDTVELNHDLLDFQVRLDDFSDQLSVCTALVSLFRQLNPDASKKGKVAQRLPLLRGAASAMQQQKGGGRVIDSFREALTDCRRDDRRGVVPPVFALSEYKIKVEKLRAERSVKELITILAKVPDESTRPSSEVQREFMEGILTDCLRDWMLAENKRPPVQTNIDSTLETLKLLMGGCAENESCFSEELRTESMFILRILNHESTGMEAVREADKMISASNAKGMLKVFSALGRKLTACARDNLAAASADKALEAKVSDLNDINNILTPLKPDHTKVDETVEVATKGLNALLEIARQGSRVFKENKKSSLSSFTELIMMKAAILREGCRSSWETWLGQRVPQQLEACHDLSSALTTMANAHEGIEGKPVANLQLLKENILKLMALVFEEKYMDTELKNRIGQALEEVDMLSGLIDGWVQVVDLLAAQGASQAADEDDFGLGEDCMTAGEKAKAKEKDLKNLAITVGAAWSKLQGYRGRSSVSESVSDHQIRSVLFGWVSLCSHGGFRLNWFPNARAYTSCYMLFCLWVQRSPSENTRVGSSLAFALRRSINYLGDADAYNRINAHIMAHLLSDISHDFADRKHKLQQTLFVTAMQAWGTAQADTTFMPFSPSMAVDSHEYASLNQVAQHIPPEEEVAKLCDLALALPSAITEEIFLMKARLKLDHLRVHGAKVLISKVKLKTTPCIVLLDGPDGFNHSYTSFPVPVEQLHIEEELVNTVRLFFNSSAEFRALITVDFDNYTEENQAVMQSLRKLAEAADSWFRVLTTEMRSYWFTGLTRVKNNLEGIFPQGWEDFCVNARDEERIMTEICNNESFNRLLACQTSLKDAIASFEQAAAKIKAEPVGATFIADAEQAITTSKKLLGVRAASSVTLIKIPSAPNPKSRQGFVRECKRLINTLNITLPTPILNAMDQALAKADVAERAV